MSLAPENSHKKTVFTISYSILRRRFYLLDYSLLVFSPDTMTGNVKFISIQVRSF